ncbi:DUF1566 domain-containing protein [Pseudomonas sp. S60]|uniref:DUF1566 domain-containing protein n=1 Tax=Pseudomonas sp. S60 TaxID=211124 RepID=UPI0019141CC7|nr:DUF1566 domain-containing protein [Pseudomonas sp. S60]MBK5008377.1 DUF1566 domain-containing protein [Pseudomonas sp. S60]
MNDTSKLPIVGEYWPGQGGLYAGTIPARGDKPAYHLVLGQASATSFEWGAYADDAVSKSIIDGLANTDALLGEQGDYPAARAARAYIADGHTDFYLPSLAELFEAWVNLGDQPWGWLWSSSQRSQTFAHYLSFEDGAHGSIDKGHVLGVRPVRQVPLSD